MATENKTAKGPQMTVSLSGIPGGATLLLTPGKGLYSDGTLDATTASATVGAWLSAIRASQDADQETAIAEVDAFLSRPKNRGLRAAPLDTFVDGIIGMRRSKALASYLAANADADPEDANDVVQAMPGCTKADKDRLTEILPAVFRGDTDRFHMGRRSGIAVRYVPGEHATDANGKPVFDANGKPAAGVRWSDEDWTKMVSKSSGDETA